MIRIDGLTPLQMEILERIWSMDSQAEVMAWFDTLPRNLRQTAHAMLMMVVIEMIDEEPCEDLALARAVIDRVRSGHA
jgi:predicted DNA-binding protein